MRSWNRQSIELTLSPRETDQLIAWLDERCTNVDRDQVGYRLGASLKAAVKSNQGPSASETPPDE